MAEDFDIELSIIADQLGKDLEAVAPQVAAEIENAVKSLAHAAYAAIVAKVQGMSLDPKNRSDYLRSLKFEELGESNYLIYLDGEAANRLEEGFGGYSIKDQLLASEKVVAVGSRAGEKWVRTSKAGKKYAAVPFDHHPSSGEKKSGDLADDIKKITVTNRAGKTQSITQIFKDLDEKPIHGKVAVAGKQENDNLSGLTKYQFVHQDTGSVSSVYMTYRMVHEDSPGWTHPGFGGYQLFKEAKEYVDHEMENILKTLL